MMSDVMLESVCGRLEALQLLNRMMMRVLCGLWQPRCHTWVNYEVLNFKVTGHDAPLLVCEVHKHSVLLSNSYSTSTMGLLPCTARVHIPDIYHDKSSHRVLTMEFVQGGGLLLLQDLYEWHCIIIFQA